MKRVILAILTVGVGVALMRAAEHRPSNISFTAYEDATSENCSDHFQLHKGEFATVVNGEETRSLPNQPLDIRAEKNGGIHVTTWDQPEFSVKLANRLRSATRLRGAKF